MNAQHITNLLANRRRRIQRRMAELDAVKAAEVRLAEKAKRDPNLGAILAQHNRLEDRYHQLT